MWAHVSAGRPLRPDQAAVGAQVVPHLLQRPAHGRTLRDARRERSALRAGYRTVLMVRSLRSLTVEPPPRPSRVRAWTTSRPGRAGDVSATSSARVRRGPRPWAPSPRPRRDQPLGQHEGRSNTMARAIEQHGPDHDRRGEVAGQPLVDELAEAALADQRRHRDQADGGDGGDAQAGDDDGAASGRSTRSTRRHRSYPMPSAASRTAGGTASSPATMFRSRISSV